MAETGEGHIQATGKTNINHVSPDTKKEREGERDHTCVRTLKDRFLLFI